MSDHRSVDYLTKKWNGHKLTATEKPPPLSRVDALQLEKILQDDATEYFNSGVVSFSDALGRIEASSWTWSIVKLYYAIFYFAKAFLAMERYLVLFYNEQPAWIKVESGALGKRFSGKRPLSSSPNCTKKKLAGSHATALYVFEKNFEHLALVNQEISSVFPTAWMMDQRESANYRLRGFPDPHPPEIFEKISQLGIRKSIGAYFNDDLYAFDKDHAIVAYPLLFMKEVHKKIENNDNYCDIFDDEKISLIRRLAKDSNGPIDVIVNFIAP